VRVSHEYTLVFVDPNLVPCAGLAPVLTLADRAGLCDLVDKHLTVPGSVGARAKALALALGAAWSPGSTPSTGWACCGTAGCGGCSSAAPR
jgi:hypothetical protein